MIETFTVEEINLIGVFGINNRAALIRELAEAVVRIDDREMADIFRNAVNKLSKLTDAEFAALELYPEYGDDSEDTENEGEGAAA